MNKWLIGILALAFCASLASVRLSEAHNYDSDEPEPQEAGAAVNADEMEEVAQEDVLPAPSMLHHLEKEMLSKIDFASTESTPVGSTMERLPDGYEAEILEHHNNYFTLDALEYGSFTGANRSEVLAVFSIEGNAHSDGFGSKLMVLYDVPTGELLLQRSFTGDHVTVVVKPHQLSNYSCVFTTATWTFHGVQHGTTDFGSLKGGIWTPIAIPALEGTRYTYDYSSAEDTLSITSWLKGTEPDFVPIHGETMEYEFSWDNMEFVPFGQ